MSSVISFDTAVLGLDKTGAEVTAAEARMIYAQGYRFVLRSMGLADDVGHSQGGQLSRAEVAGLHTAGVAVGAFQLNFLQPAPSTQSGEADGRYLTGQAAALGMPQDNTMSLWFDLEGNFQHSESAKVRDYLNAWAGAIADAGFVPSVYIGKQFILSSGDINALASVFRGFWQGGGYIPTTMPEVGYQIYQLWPLAEIVAGVAFDINVVQQDFLDRQTAFFSSS